MFPERTSTFPIQGWSCAGTAESLGGWGDNLLGHMGATVSFWLLDISLWDLKEAAESHKPCWSSGYMEAMKSKRMKTMASEDKVTTRRKSLGKGPVCSLTFPNGNEI